MTTTYPMTTTELTEAERWTAVERRDSRFDGVFVYAVRSTGIYCRPSCPSRRPRREVVEYFATPDEAERAGFRACRRCAPDQRVAPTAALVERARQWIEEHADESISLRGLGDVLGTSPYHLQRTFKRALGVTPRQYAEALRFERVKARLRAGDDVTRALYDAGYGSSSRLYAQAQEQLGMTPGTYRRGGQGLRIGYTIVDSPLGRLLVAATEHGVCAISLGADDAALEAALRQEFPAAELARDDERLRPVVAALLDHLDGRQPGLDLPLDVEGTAFQRRVWDALRMIPYGGTRSYGDVAAAIGEPGAVRAVAHACAHNPAALVIPCHRVVRKGGALGGYRWGIERKEALLARERVSRPA